MADAVERESTADKTVSSETCSFEQSLNTNLRQAMNFDDVTSSASSIERSREGKSMKMSDKHDTEGNGVSSAFCNLASSNQRNSA